MQKKNFVLNCYFANNALIIQIVYKVVPGLLEDQLKEEREYCRNQSVNFNNSGSHLLKLSKVQKILKEEEEEVIRKKIELERKMVCY